jgi:hypothetical protein
MLLLGCLSAQTQNTAQTPAPQHSEPAATAPSQPRIDPAKEADIRQFMEVAGIKTLMAQTLANMSKSMKPLMNQALPPGAYRDKLVELFFAKFESKADLQQVLDLIVPIYDKYLSDDEIKGLIKFYQTPVGQKMVKVMPQLMTESQEASQKWGETLGRQSMLEVLSEHPDLQKAMEEAKQ